MRIWRAIAIQAPVVFLIAFTARGYAYSIVENTPADDSPALALSLESVTDRDRLQSSLSHRGADGATLEHQLKYGNSLSFVSSYSNRLNESFETDSASSIDGFWDMRMVSAPTDLLPKVELDFSVGGFDGESGGAFEDEEQQRVGIKTQGSLGFVDHGASYNRTGSEYDVIDKKEKAREKDRDKSVSSYWVGKSFGKVYLSQFVEEKHKNIDGGRKPEVVDSLVGSSLKYTWSKWPHVGTSVSHATGDRYSADGVDVGISSLKAVLSASHTKWSAAASISQITPEDDAGNYFGQADSTNVYLGGSYYPSKRLVITPSINHSVQSYRDWGVETETVSTAMSIVYRPHHRKFRIKAYASYDTLENVEWGMDTNYFYSKASIEWELNGKRGLRNLLSLSLGYDRYEDELYSRSNTEDYSIKLTLKSYSLDNLFRPRNRVRNNNYSFLNGLTATPVDHID